MEQQEPPSADSRTHCIVDSQLDQDQEEAEKQFCWALDRVHVHKRVQPSAEVLEELTQEKQSDMSHGAAPVSL
ncbi:hypothetical protein Y1Q_0014824 [Alligator mississippiensis]|uniref:Uncharacterized protein n=1 Tax=Alligator mississippiensis TaxID=8496 RepID=A0A151M230_ALLMI|nr:hypothetical protein Y1Q_0014824 [Alligator mississippiensis]